MAGRFLGSQKDERSLQDQRLKVTTQIIGYQKTNHDSKKKKRVLMPLLLQNNMEKKSPQIQLFTVISSDGTLLQKPVPQPPRTIQDEVQSVLCFTQTVHAFINGGQLSTTWVLKTSPQRAGSKITFLTYDAASSSVQTSALIAPRRLRPLTTGLGGGGEISSSLESARELAFCRF